jgi:hypothetical protein
MGMLPCEGRTLLQPVTSQAPAAIDVVNPALLISQAVNCKMPHIDTFGVQHRAPMVDRQSTANCHVRVNVCGLTTARSLTSH